MSKNLIDVLLTPPEKLWLKAILNKQNSGQEVSERVLKVELRGKLPNSFDPSETSSLLLRSKTGITLLGIGLIDPENQIIKTTDLVIQSVQEILKTSPTTQRISAQQISDVTKLKIADIEEVLEKLASVSLFHNSGINGSRGWSEINIEEKAFDNYLKHDSIAEWLKDKADEIYYSKGLQITTIKKNSQAISGIDLTMQTQADKQKVFVVHGRNEKARKAIYAFLRSIGLHPLEWSEAVKATGKPSPYVGEILDLAFSKAQAIVVLFTPDDEARLLEQFRYPDDEKYETELTPQARPNVIFEAGMAMGRSSERTVLVELGKLRPFSDIYGRHVIRLNNSTEIRQELAHRLETAGCSVNLVGTEWHKEGNFEDSIVIQNTKLSSNITKLSSTINEVEKPLTTSQSKSKNLKVKKLFTDREKDQFETEAFEFIARFFEDSLQELEKQNSHINTNFRRIDANHFNATIYLNNAQANICSIRLNSDRYTGQGITYSHGRANADINDSLSIAEDGYNLYLKAMSNLYYSDEEHNLNFEGGAEYFWEKFIRPLQQ